MTGGFSSVTRTSALWLMAAQVMVLIPLWNVVPLSLTLLGLLVLLWRVSLWFGRGFWPPRWLRMLLVVFALTTVAVSFRPLISLESATSILAAGYSLKLLEMKRQRDALVVIYIGYFVTATAVLYSQTILQTLYLLTCLVVLIAAQQGLYRQSNDMPVLGSLRYGAILVLQAFPMTALFFVLVPRIDPLWSVPLPDHSATTGISDSMSPGDIARLSRSDELAFRATFTGQVPPVNERYWRAIVMDQFDGKTWRQTEYSSLRNRGIPLSSWQSGQPALDGWWREKNTGYGYEIMMEPSGRPWLFTLGAAGQVVEDSFVVRTRRLESTIPVNVRKLYRPESSWPVNTTALPEWFRQLNLQLPEGVNRRSRLLAKQMSDQAGGDPVKIAGRLMSMFGRERFFYTLSPSVLGVNSVDEFLFETRRGFCSHFAGAFVFLMRAAGVPARVVAGYQGGEYKPDQNLIQVRQFDAHAWAEIWVEGQGWLRFDPTAAVSPTRIESGLEAALGSEGSFLADSPASLYRYRNIDFLNRFRLAYENLEYQWQRSVINYQKEQQETFLRNILGSKDLYWRLATLLGAGTGVIIGLLCLVLLYRRQRADPLLKINRAFSRKCARQGFHRKKAEGMLSFGQRIADQNPTTGKAFLMFCEVYVAAGYANTGSVRDSQLRQLKALLKRL